MRQGFTIAIGILFALLLGAALYVSAATASVFESYQPGINDVLLRVNPNLIVLMVVGTPLAAAFVPQVRAAASQMARTFGLIGLATAAAVLIGLAALEWLDTCIAVRPANRELRSTVEYSLRCPELSNRSYAGPIYAGGLRGLLLWAARRRQGGAHKRTA